MFMQKIAKYWYVGSGLGTLKLIKTQKVYKITTKNIKPFIRPKN